MHPRLMLGRTRNVRSAEVRPCGTTAASASTSSVRTRTVTEDSTQGAAGVAAPWAAKDKAQDCWAVALARRGPTLAAAGEPARNRDVEVDSPSAPARTVVS